MRTGYSLPVPKQDGQRLVPLQYEHLPFCILPLPSHALHFLLPLHSWHTPTYSPSAWNRTYHDSVRESFVAAPQIATRMLLSGPALPCCANKARAGLPLTMVTARHGEGGVPWASQTISTSGQVKHFAHISKNHGRFDRKNSRQSTLSSDLTFESPARS